LNAVLGAFEFSTMRSSSRARMSLLIAQTIPDILFQINDQKMN
jgi:hypothetical protein